MKLRKPKERTEEEIKEYNKTKRAVDKAVSGKSGVPQRNVDRKGVTSERDCLAKKEILTPLLQRPMTSRELYEASGYKGSYNNFTSHLTKYCRGGKRTKYGRMGDDKYVYLRKIGKRPSLYELTDFGFINAENPYLNRDEAIRVYKRKLELTVENVLAEHPEWLNVEGQGFDGSGGVDYVDHSSSNNDFGGNRDFMIGEYKEKIKKDDFFKDVNEDDFKKIVALGDKELMLDFMERQKHYHYTHKVTMNLYNNPNNIPTGKKGKKKDMPDYFDIIFKFYKQSLETGQDIDVTEEIYKAIPYCFYKHYATGKIRLKSRVEAGNYQKNGDGKVLEYSEVIFYLFGGNMKIGVVATTENDEDIIKVYYYHGDNSAKRYHLLNASMEQYDVWKNGGNPAQNNKVNATMNGRPMGGSPLQPEKKSSGKKGNNKPSGQQRMIIKPQKR